MNLSTARVLLETFRNRGTFTPTSLVSSSKPTVHSTVSLEIESADGEDRELIGRFTGLSFDVDDVHAKYQDLSSRGVILTGTPERQQWGGIIATLSDPSC